MASAILLDANQSLFPKTPSLSKQPDFFQDLAFVPLEHSWVDGEGQQGHQGETGRSHLQLLVAGMGRWIQNKRTGGEEVQW